MSHSSTLQVKSSNTHTNCWVLTVLIRDIYINCSVLTSTRHLQSVIVVNVPCYCLTYIGRPSMVIPISLGIPYDGYMMVYVHPFVCLINIYYWPTNIEWWRIMITSYWYSQWWLRMISTTNISILHDAMTSQAGLQWFQWRSGVPTTSASLSSSSYSALLNKDLDVKRDGGHDEHGCGWCMDDVWIMDR